MKKSTFNYIKDILKDYPNIDRYIKERELELRIPSKQDDLNSGIRGNRVSDSMTNMLITIEQDRRLSALERNKRVIEDNLNNCDSDTKKIIEELYIERYPRYKMQGLVDNMLINCGRTKGFQLRDRFFENVADDLRLDK
ncbi:MULTISPECIES: transcriptional regulator [unclassified Facklamia]|uniref:transcriptional regulator n=1 Tax=Aerococcaceae TaxID=186827 RepID=UPI0013B807E2|nr:MULTISPECIES: transcriptional regulator [unclassified Facklamia]NEW64266.1 transcriptional regulator [Facklamia sp. 252]NEW68781.1 transcriptional regulator [Facklamia sp. 253]QQD64732.1 transcriptional regulator [Aerococcaceae bacterium zg-252]